MWDGRYCGNIFRKPSATTLNKIMIIKSSEPSGRSPQGTWLIKSLLIVKVLRVACTFNLTNVFHWPWNLAFCIMKSNKTQSWALRLHTSYLLPKRLYLLLSTNFYTDLVLPWDGFHGIPLTVLLAATLLGPGAVCVPSVSLLLSCGGSGRWLLWSPQPSLSPLTCTWKYPTWGSYFAMLDPSLENVSPADLSGF